MAKVTKGKNNNNKSNNKKYYSSSNLEYAANYSGHPSGTYNNGKNIVDNIFEKHNINDKKTVTKNDRSVPYSAETTSALVNGPRKNPLFAYATFNTLFTLSALNQEDITNPGLLLSAKNPHDIIVRSGGIGNDARESARSANSLARQESYFQTELGKEAFRRSRSELAGAKDLFFNNVTIRSIPPLNSDRRLTAVTKIEMEIIEPMGLTLLDKIRGASANCGFLDHVDAPYLLTIEFAGFDEQGRPVPTVTSEKRKIPVKLTNIRLNVNAGQTTYNVTAIAYNEFGFVNRFNYTRTGGTIVKGQNLGETMNDFVQQLNEAYAKETVQNKFAERGKHDRIQITLDPQFANLMPDPEKMEVKDFYLQKQQRKPKHSQKAKTKRSDAVISIIQALMKSTKEFEDGTELKGFLDKVQASVNSNRDSESFYYDYFAIDSAVVPNPEKFDKIRGTHPKTVKFHIYPHRVHAYVVSQPGTSTGVDFNPFVKKEYNYIFTGDNVDVLDLDIDYKVAYYQTKLKDVDGSGGEEASKEDGKQTEKEFVPEQRNVFVDPPFIYKMEPGVVKTLNAAHDRSSRLDQLFDAITNPSADMVNIKMTILGDPAWLGQTQFIPVSIADITAGPTAGTGTKFGVEDTGKLRTSDNSRTIWNETFQNFNANYGEPLIRLNFRTPTDFDPEKGTYLLSGAENLAFSGLYRVVGCTSIMADGKFTQELDLVRCKNQGTEVFVPATTEIDKSSRSLSRVEIMRKFHENYKLKPREYTHSELSNNIGKSRELDGSFKSKEKIIEEMDIIVKEIKGFY